MARGKFLTLEGLDGAGKGTHLEWLVRHLQAGGHTVVVTREPGGTPLGEKLRGLLLSDAMHLETEALLMFAARRQHLAEVIEPALDRGDWVVSDRFTDASYAYQGGGRGLSNARLAVLEQWVQGDLQPDLTLLFDVPVDVAHRRIVDMQRDLDRFELERAEFFQRVRSAYLQRAAAFPNRIHVINANRALADIQKSIEECIATI